MFKRKPRSYLQTVVEFFYPRGGWYRATRYVIHRVRRLPDPAHRIGRGIGVGVAISFTPFFGMHFVLAMLIAWIIRGNVLAALFATFFGNPVTFPFIVEGSLGLGAAILNLPFDMHLPQVVDAFGRAASELWANLMALFTEDQAHWGGLHRFFRRVFLPYLVGGFILGTSLGVAAHFASQPLINAYQRRRVRRLKKRYEKRLAEHAAGTETDDAQP